MDYGLKHHLLKTFINVAIPLGLLQLRNLLFIERKLTRGHWQKRALAEGTHKIAGS